MVNNDYGTKAFPLRPSGEVCASHDRPLLIAIMMARTMRALDMGRRRRRMVKRRTRMAERTPLSCDNVTRSHQGAEGLEPRILVLTGDHRLPDLTKPGHRYNEEDLVAHRAMQEALGTLRGLRFEFCNDHPRLLDTLKGAPPDLVVNFCDTGYCNVAAQELHVPALLELLGIPYTGAPPACMALCYDKQAVRLLAEAQGVAVPREVFLETYAPPDLTGVAWPALIKPNQADGSLGITKDAVVRSEAEARTYIEWARRELPGRALLVQEYLPGAEYGIGLVGNPGDELMALPVLEVDFSGLPAGLSPILSYESKTIPSSPYWSEIRFCEAILDPATHDRMIADARRLFARLGCRDYARFDFRLGADGTARLMEVNPNPAWGYDGKLTLMAGFAGISYAALLEMILNAALRRLGTV
jgi:D-alanine-D-alanine ligase